jgi:AAA family ATP:ADP antiporter
MKIGVFATFMSPLATPQMIRDFGRRAEGIGLDSIWMGEHVVLFDRTEFPYPGSRDGKLPVPVGGGMLDGIKLVAGSPYLLGICLYVALYSMLSTFLYFQQQQIVKASMTSSEERTALFASIDLAVNLLTLGLQVFAFSRLLRWLGVAAGLVLVPLLSVAGFLVLGFASTLTVLIVFGVARRAGEFAISKPTRETLFNALSSGEKYKAKNFMDTAVYRAGDMASGWIFTWLQQHGGFALAGISFLSAPVAALWARIGLWLAHRHRLMTAESAELAAAGTIPITREKTK